MGHECPSAEPERRGSTNLTQRKPSFLEGGQPISFCFRIFKIAVFDERGAASPPILLHAVSFVLFLAGGAASSPILAIRLLCFGLGAFRFRYRFRRQFLDRVCDAARGTHKLPQPPKPTLLEQSLSAPEPPLFRDREPWRE